MVALKEIIAFLERIAPNDLAEEYDNVGLLVGDKEAEVESILISLDTDAAIASEAADRGHQLIISHHPLFFKPLKNILMQNSIGKTVYTLIKNNISLYALHTNIDAVNGGLCDYFLDLVGKSKTYGTFTGEGVDGIGRLAKLNNPMSLAELLSDIKKTLNLDHINFVGDINQKISTIGICNGGGADFIYDAYERGADVYISGDFKYHHARFAYENQMPLIEISHYDAEIHFCSYMKELLQEQFADRLNIDISSNNPNVWKNFKED